MKTKFLSFCLHKLVRVYERDVKSRWDTKVLAEIDAILMSYSLNRNVCTPSGSETNSRCLSSSFIDQEFFREKHLSKKIDDADDGSSV